MTKLLVLCEYPTLSGGERSMLATLGAVQEAGFSVAALAPAAGPLAAALADRGVELVPWETADGAGPEKGDRHHLPRSGPKGASHKWCLSPFSGGGRLPQTRLREELAAALRRHRPALVHANSLAMGRLAGPVAAELGIPSVAHLRDILGLSRRAIGDLNRNTRLLAVSEATRRFHVDAGLDPAKTHVLHNGVDLDQFRPRAATGYLHRELGIPPAAPLVGGIGQIGLRKGFDVLAKAAWLARRRLPGAHYMLAGSRWSGKAESVRFEAELRAAAERMPGRVHLVGYRDDVPRLLCELTLLVHPARQEPLGRVLLEAAAAGVPIVATDVGGTPEIFPPEARAARLVPPDDPAGLASAMADLLEHSAVRTRLGDAAHRRAEAAFNSATAAAGLIRHYRELMEGGAVPGTG